MTKTTTTEYTPEFFELMNKWMNEKKEEFKEEPKETPETKPKTEQKPLPQIFIKRGGRNNEVVGIRAIMAADYLTKVNRLFYAVAPNAERGTYYKYNNKKGLYEPTSEVDIEEIVMELLRSYNELDIVTSKNRKEIIELMRPSIPRINYTEFNADENIINFKNGILKLDSLMLEPHSPEYFTTIQIPVNWNPAAKDTPVFDAYMDTLTALHDDAEDVKKFLLEVIGVVLSNVPGWKYKTSLLMFGKGNTGKSQLRNLICELISPNNTATIELDELESERGPSKAFNKRLVGSPDMKFGTVSQMSKFKDIVGGDPVGIRWLYKEPFDAKLNCVFWNVSNTLPLFGGDKGKHVYERIIPVRCDNVIPEDKRDPEIYEKMLAEGEGIVYKAIFEMFNTVHKGYKYSIPESSLRETECYKRNNNICIEFYEEFCKFDDDETPTLHTEAEVRRTFAGWAKLNYGSVPKKDEFERTLREYLNITDKELHLRTKSMRMYCFTVRDDAFAEYAR